MEYLDHLRLGLEVALSLDNFLYCMLGALIGTLVGVLPGLGPVTTIAMLLPLALKMPAVSGIIMLAGIYYGAHHAGSTTAIMLNMPGEPTAIVICLDGHPMAKQGKAGVALFVAAIGSFFAGCVGVIIIATLSPWLAKAGLAFGAAEYTALIIMALVTAAVLSTKSPLTPIAMAALGVLLGTVGGDIYTSTARFTFGYLELSEGLGVVAIATGLFAFAEVAAELSAGEANAGITAKLTRLIPSKAEFKASIAPILRGTGLGAVFGILPGTGPLISSFASYALERQIATDRSRFGKGAIEGVAGPEAATNAAAITHFIPMLALGIPAGAANALMLGALVIKGVSPGPKIMVEHADVFWGLVVSMWIGNMMLLILNLPLVGLWVRLLMIPYRLLMPTVLVFCSIGVYTVANDISDVLVAILFGAIGFVFRKLDCPVGPLVLGVVLGPTLEQYARRALLLSRGDPTVFLTRPISLAVLLFTVAIVAAVLIQGRSAALAKVNAP